MDTPEAAGRRRMGQARVVFGVVMMVVGALLLLDRFDVSGWPLNVPFWPWALVVLGLVRLSNQATDERRRARGYRLGTWLLLVGLWGLVNEYRLFGVHYDRSWPFLLVGAGLFVVWLALDPSSPRACTVRREP
jgi:hypothetical protein